MVNSLDHEFPTINDDSMLLLMRLARIITCLLILCTNVPIIIFIMNQRSKTFLDWLIVFDCFLCLSNLSNVILLVNTLHDSINICTCHVFLSFFTSLCNRLLSLGIVIYRFILILGSSFVFTNNQRKALENIILLAILLISLNLTGWAIYYREEYRYFLSKVKS